MTSPSPFLTSVRETMRMRGYSVKTEKAYLYWIKLLFYFTINATQRLWERTKLASF